MPGSWMSAAQAAPGAGQGEQVERRFERFDVFLAASLACPTHGMRGMQQIGCSVRNLSQGGAAVYVGPAFVSLPDMVIVDIHGSSFGTVSVNGQVVGRRAGMLHLAFLKDLDATTFSAMLADSA